MKRSAEQVSRRTNERGKRFGHQRRIPKAALQEARRALLSEKDAINNTKDFNTLYSIVSSALRDVYRTGKLYRYDISLRISYYLNIFPTKVYLHCRHKNRR